MFNCADSCRYRVISCVTRVSLVESYVHECYATSEHPERCPGARMLAEDLSEQKKDAEIRAAFNRILPGTSNH